MAEPVFLGIDIGTGSVRCGLVTPTGSIVARAVRPIRTWAHTFDGAATSAVATHEQSTEDIWNSLSVCVKEVVESAGSAVEVRGVGVDATCSLVLCDEKFRPVSVSPPAPAFEREAGDDGQLRDIILWMDHRALQQASRITATGHDVLRYVGGTISPEMEVPKMLWLSENSPEAFARTAHFFDLADWLTWRLTGDLTRSLCTVVCKWTFVASPANSSSGWRADFFEQIGLGQLTQDGFSRLGGDRVRDMGEPLGAGVTEKTARELGLSPGTPVGVGIIDAHAGGLGVLGTVLPGKDEATGIDSAVLEQRLAVISGTSSCHMAASSKELFVDGIWGPYYSAMLPKMWLQEGGQSATGKLIDHVIHTHPAAGALQESASAAGQDVYTWLNEYLCRLGGVEEFDSLAIARLSSHIHVLPYFHGNRSPRADPTLTGTVTGLTLSSTVRDLALLYLATVQAVSNCWASPVSPPQVAGADSGCHQQISYGTRHIIETLNKGGYRINTIFLTGGGGNNDLFVRTLADACRCRVVRPVEDAVLVGSAVLGAVASGLSGDIFAAMGAMNKLSAVVEPEESTTKFHEAKYQVFLELYRTEMTCRKLMEEAERTGL
jgi:D-ribulokinase